MSAFLELAQADLDAAEVLARVGNHYAAYHVQQAVEKLLKAVLLGQGIEAGIEHRLDVLVARLPADDGWGGRLTSYVHYSAYATAFRYPTPGGRLTAAPPSAEILRDVAAVRGLLAIARSGAGSPP